MVYTSQAIKNDQSVKLQSVKFRGWGRLNLNMELLQTKSSDFKFNLTNVMIHNTCHVIVFSVGVIFSNLFRCYEIGCIKLVLKRLRTGHFQTVVSFLYALYPILFFLLCNSIAMLYTLHKYNQK